MHYIQSHVVALAS